MQHHAHRDVKVTSVTVTRYLRKRVNEVSKSCNVRQEDWRERIILLHNSKGCDSETKMSIVPPVTVHRDRRFFFVRKCVLYLAQCPVASFSCASISIHSVFRDVQKEKTAIKQEQTSQWGRHEGCCLKRCRFIAKQNVRVSKGATCVKVDQMRCIEGAQSKCMTEEKSLLYHKVCLTHDESQSE